MPGNDSYTKLLLHMDGDQSSHQHKIQTSGDQFKFRSAEKKFGNSSFYCPGGNGYTRTVDHSSLDWGTGSFTVDFWINTFADNIQVMGKGVSTNGWYIHITAGTGTLTFRAGSTPSIIVESTTDMTDGEWHHVAVSRSGSSVRLFIDGDQEDSALFSTNFNTNADFVIGRTYEGASGQFIGYLDEIRLSKDIARWTSNFTPPTSPYISDDDTSFLCHCEGDQSSSKHEIGLSHDMQSLADIWRFEMPKGSWCFNGSSQVTIPDSDDWHFGSSNFTIDTWVNFDNITGTNSICGQYQPPGPPQSYWAFSLYGSPLRLRFFHYDSAAGSAHMYTEWTPTTGTWYHIAVVRNGDTWYLFIDGISQSLTLNSGSYSSAMPNVPAEFTIGGSMSAIDLKGYLEEFRVSNETARWTSNFTPPQNPYSDHSMSGNLNDGAQVIVIDEGNWEIDATGHYSTGVYEIDTTSGTKLIAARNTHGEIVGYGNVEPTT